MIPVAATAPSCCISLCQSTSLYIKSKNSSSKTKPSTSNDCVPNSIPTGIIETNNFDLDKLLKIPVISSDFKSVMLFVS